MRRAAVVALLLVAGCGDVDEDVDATRAMVLATCAPDDDRVAREVCECAYDELVDRLDADALEDLDRQLRDDPETVPAAVTEVALRCAFDRVAPPEAKPATTSSSSSSSSSSTSTTRLP